MRPFISWSLLLGGKTCVLASLLLLGACSGSGGDSGTASTSSDSSATSSSSSAASATVGLDVRPVNNTCLAWMRPTLNEGIALNDSFASLPAFALPIAMLQAPGDSSRWFVVEQGGNVRQFQNQSNVSTASTFVNIAARVTSGGERGLLGMAFHPGFPADPRVFLSYTATTSDGLESRIAVFTTADGGQTLTAASEQILLRVAQPEANHNGGHIAFGPDGYLYIGLGDGGGAGDPHGPIGNGQDLNTLLGKLLRIDVGGAGSSGYSIPGDNPFAANPKCDPTGGVVRCPEIYAYGFRNPWRFSFDKATGDLWLGDVGQGLWEEINRVQRGGNYGWRCREGAHDYLPASCSTANYLDPVAEYPHNSNQGAGSSVGQSVTGGYVYRGVQNTALRGRYLFADYVSGRIWAWLPEQATTARRPTELLASGINIASFGEANDGELYVVGYGGRLYHIGFQTTGASAVPSQLSATGCVNAADSRQPATGLIPYDINAPFWSDSASKERWLALPAGQNIAVQGNGDWNLPNGSVLMKHFRIANQWVETRLLMRDSAGNWSGYSYEWNEAQTDAMRVQGGRLRTLANGQQWLYPSEAQCLECHTQVAGRSLGLTTAQMNRSLLYTSTGRTANQLDTLSAISVLTPAVASAAAPMLTSPADSTAGVAARARAYLESNCAHCHQPGGPTPIDMDLRADTALSATATCNVPPIAGDQGLVDARIIAPGAAMRSVLVERIKRRDAHGMPPLGSNRVDDDGVALLAQWVNDLPGC